jgi:hypothetical protein
MIVASKSVDADEIEDAGLDAPSLVFGRAVCVVDFYDVTGDDGDYAWHVRNPRRVEPIEVRGSASLYHVPDERIRLVDGNAVQVTFLAHRGPPVRGAQRARARSTRRAAPIQALLGPKKPSAPPKCPTCGAGKPIAIVYGLPGPDAQAEATRGRVELGGCCTVSGEDPAWRCRVCGVAYGISL